MARACIAAIGLVRPTLKAALDASDDFARFSTGGPAAKTESLTPPKAVAQGGDVSPAAAAAGSSKVSSTSEETLAKKQGGEAEPAAAEGSTQPFAEGGQRGDDGLNPWTLLAACKKTTDAAVGLGAVLYPPLDRKQIEVRVRKKTRLHQPALGNICCLFGAYFFRAHR